MITVRRLVASALVASALAFGAALPGVAVAQSAAKVLVFRIEASTFPNWDRTERRRGFILDGNTLTHITPGTHGAGATWGVWKRAS